MLVSMPCGYLSLVAMALLGGDGLCAFDCVPQPLSTRECALESCGGEGGREEAGGWGEREGRERREAGEGRGAGRLP